LEQRTWMAGTSPAMTRIRTTSRAPFFMA
jgi:hypothetical protein